MFFIFGYFDRLPKRLTGFQMVSTTIDGITTLFTIGGSAGGAVSDMLRLECSGSLMFCAWRRFAQLELDVARSSHVVIPLDDSFASTMCNTGMAGNINTI